MPTTPDPRGYPKGNTYFLIRGPILNDKKIEEYIRRGYYGEAAKRALEIKSSKKLKKSTTLSYAKSLLRKLGI